MKIAIGVHGRYHAFHLAKALVDEGHDVVVFTNYPRSVAARWGLPRERVRSFLLHGVLARTVLPFRALNPELVDSLVQRSFGRWLERQLARDSWDVVHLWSGIGEEALGRRPRLASAMFIMRGSAHIRVQDRLLQEEEGRLGLRLERPSQWIVAREEREYAAADRVVVLSRFAEATFLAQDVAPERLARLPLAAPVERYRPSEPIVRDRVERLRDGKPIRFLFVGALSARKGLHDLLQAAARLPRERFALRLVGSVVSETQTLLRRAPPEVQVLGKRPERELPEHYWWADVFVLPTLEDGFAVVLAQAAAAGLPIVTTANSGGPEIVREGQTGWIVPIRSPDALANRLRWFDTNRSEAIAMAEASRAAAADRPWAAVARDFLAICSAYIDTERPRTS